MIRSKLPRTGALVVGISAGFFLFGGAAYAQVGAVAEWGMKSGKPQTGALYSLDDDGKTVTLLVPKTFRLNQFDEATQKKILDELNKQAKAKETDANFHKRLEVEGTGTKETNAFQVTGEPVTLSWAYASSHSGIPGVMQVFVHSDKTKQLVDLAVNENGIKGNDHSRLRLPPGSYYLKVNAANCNWKIRVLEQRKPEAAESSEGK